MVCIEIKSVIPSIISTTTLMAGKLTDTASDLAPESHREFVYITFLLNI